jgi:hypothetical protein
MANTSGTIIPHGSLPGFTFPDNLDILGTLSTSLGDVDSRIGSKLSNDVTIADLQDEAVTWISSKGFYDLTLYEPASYAETNHIDVTDYTLDWDGPPKVNLVVTGNVTISVGTTPDQGTFKWRVLWLTLTNSQSTNVTYTGPEGVISRTYDTPSGVVSERLLELFFVWDGTNVTYDWKGPQDGYLAVNVGGTGVGTGIAPDGLEVLGTVTYTTTTNAEFELLSGTMFSLDNSKNNHILTPSSRLSASEEGSYRIVRRVMMSPPSAERIISFDTNAYALIGLNQYNTNPANMPFEFEIVNYGQYTSNNIAIGYVSTNRAPSGGGAASGSTLTDNLLFALEFEDASSPATDSSGNGYTFSELNGSFLWQSAAGKVGTYSITNNADTTLALTNANAALNIGGANPFSLSIWAALGDEDTESGFLIGRWHDDTVNDYSWSIRPNLGVYRLYYSVNGTGSLNELTSTTVDAGWVHLFFVYDPTGPSFKLSKNGGAFETVVLDGQINTGTAPFIIGAYMFENTAFASPAPVGIDQVAYWDVAQPLSVGQTIYNSGSGLPFSSW